MADAERSTNTLRAEFVAVLSLLTLSAALLTSSLTVVPALAETRTPAEATQHALDELANCRAQNRRDAGQICPTETATPSPTPPPTSTPQPAATATPVSEAATATPLPLMPVSGNGYVRPLDDYGLEIALQQGRWAVYQADDCGTRVDPWVNVVTQVQDTGEVDLISETADCGLVAEQWLSDAPCSVNDQGVCDVSADASFWDMLSHLPTPSPTPVPPATPTRAAAQPQARQPAASAPQAQVRTVVQTVIVVVTAEPPETPVSIESLSPSPTHTPTANPTNSPTATPTLSREPTALLAAITATPLQTATPPRTEAHASSASAGRWDWLGFLRTAGLVVLIGGVAVWVLTRRKVVRWGARPNRSGGGVQPHA